jgi:hypothetical protein
VEFAWARRMDRPAQGPEVLRWRRLAVEHAQMTPGRVSPSPHLSVWRRMTDRWSADAHERIDRHQDALTGNKYAVHGTQSRPAAAFFRRWETCRRVNAPRVPNGNSRGRRSGSRATTPASEQSRRSRPAPPQVRRGRGPRRELHFLDRPQHQYLPRASPRCRPKSSAGRPPAAEPTSPAMWPLQKRCRWSTRGAMVSIPVSTRPPAPSIDPGNYWS